MLSIYLFSGYISLCFIFQMAQIQLKCLPADVRCNAKGERKQKETWESSVGKSRVKSKSKSNQKHLFPLITKERIKNVEFGTQ